MLARTGGSEGATEDCGLLLPWHWPCALVVEQLTVVLELFRQLRQKLRDVAVDGGSERGANYRGSRRKRTQANNRTLATAIASGAARRCDVCF